MNARADHAPAFAHVLQRRRDQRADGSEDDPGIQLFRRLFPRPARPGAAERTREVLRFSVAVAGEREDAAALPHRDLRDDVRGGAEAVETQPVPIPGELQRAPADQPGA